MDLNLAVRAHDFDRRNTPEELAKEIGQTGIQSIQFALPVSFPAIPSGAKNLSPGLGSSFRRVFAVEGIEITVLSCYINMIHPDLEEREAALEKFFGYLQNARAFGASMVATETGNVDAEIHYTERNFTAEAFEKVVESVQRMAQVAEKVGMTVGIEGGLNHPVYSPEKVRELLDRVQSPNVQIILDITNFIQADTYTQQRDLIDRSFNLFGKELAAIHLKDFVIEDSAVNPAPIGTGLLDFPYLLEKVRREKPCLHLIMEETREADIPAAIAYLKKCNALI